MKEARPATVPQEGEITDTIIVDLAVIPEYVWDSLAAATLERYKAFISIPGNVEWLDQRLAARKAAVARERS